MNAPERPAILPITSLPDCPFKAIVKSAPLVLTAIRSDGMIETMVGQAMEALGRHSSEFVGRNFFDLCHDNPVVLDAARRTLQGETVGPVETELSGKTFETRFSPTRDERGRITGITGVCIDVTARRRAETVARKLNRFHEAMIRTAAEGIGAWMPIDTSPGVKFFVWNDRMVEITGYTLTEVNRQGLSLIVPDERFYQRAFQRMRSGDHLVDEQRAIRRRDGEQRIITISTSDVETEEGTALVAMVQDVTERKRAEAEVARQRDQLAHIHRLQTAGEMVTAMAHELSQPLTVVAQYADACELILEDRRAVDLDHLATLTRALGEQCQRAGQVIRRLRSHVSKTNLKRVPTRLDRLIHETLQLHRFAWPTGIQIAVSAAAGLPSVLVDKTLIQQVLLNLLNNAAEAVASGPEAGHEAGTEAVRVAAEVESDQRVLVAVIDRGPGPGDCDPEAFFTPFFTTKPNGMGIGLSLSRSIIEAHGGQLCAAANGDRGMAFRFTLPRAG